MTGHAGHGPCAACGLPYTDHLDADPAAAAAAMAAAGCDGYRTTRGEHHQRPYLRLVPPLTGPRQGDPPMTATEINPARDELLALAAKMRGPQWAEWLGHALAGTTNAPGWPWDRVYGEVFRMLLDRHAQPRDLTEVTRRATWPAAGTISTPETQAAFLAQMRAALPAPRSRR